MLDFTKIKPLFEKLNDAHPIYKKASNEKKIQIDEAFIPIFDKLEKLGIDRLFSEALLFFGKEFLDSLPSSKKKDQKLSQVEEAELIFGVKAEVLTEQELRDLKLAKKYNALSYKPLKATKGKAKVEILIENKVLTNQVRML